MSKVEEGVHVWQERVTDLHRCLGGVNYRRPDVRLLRVGRQRVVVAVEWEEGRELEGISVRETHTSR